MAIRELDDYTLVYWKISLQWRGRSKSSSHTVGDALAELGIIEKGHARFNLPKRAAALREDIIQGQDDDDALHDITATHT